MAEQVLATERKVALYAFRTVFADLSVSLQSTILLQDIAKDGAQRVPLRGSLVKHVTLAVVDIDLTTAKPDAVMAAVALFLEEEEKLLQPPKWVTVLLGVIAVGLAEPDIGNPAFVLDWVAHCEG